MEGVRLAALETAESDIWCELPYLVPPTDLTRPCQALAKRGFSIPEPDLFSLKCEPGLLNGSFKKIDTIVYSNMCLHNEIRSF